MISNRIEFRVGTSRNIEISEQQQPTNRNAIMKENNPNQPSSQLSKCQKKWWILILIISIIIVGGIIALVIVLKNKDKEEDKNEEPLSPITLSLPNIDIEETKKVFSPSFKINSKEKTLNQLCQKSFQTYESANQGKKSSYSLFTKAIYDIYTINSTSSPSSENIFYTSKYTTVITVNSLCSTISKNPEEDNCQLKQQLDLNKRDESNLRRNEEDVDELIRKAILPICLVEHTDTNLILSITCPETLDPSYKDDIIRAFGNIKPDSMKGFDFDKNYVDTITEEKEDKIYIYSFDNVCLNPNVDPKKTILCKTTKNIITDKEGNLIYSKISNSTETINDENNSFLYNFTYEFSNIPNENSESFDEEVYKKNLEIILSLTNSLMKKEIFIENITNLAIDLMTEEGVKESNEIRDLMEQESLYPGVQEENVFTKTICDISMDLNLKNDVGLTEDKTVKASSIYNVNMDNYTELSNYKLQIYLHDVIKKFINLSKGGNKMAAKLYEDLNDPLLNFMDVISENIEKINKILANKDLSEIFDSTLEISQIKNLTFEFVTATNNLFLTMEDLSDKILYEINNARKKLEENISTFLSESHNLIFKIFNNLTDLSNALSTDSNIIVGIASYYLNNTEKSYYEIIQKAKSILDNYFKNEKNLILPLVDSILEKFYKNAKDSMEKYQSLLDGISERINEGKIYISLANPENYQKCISNIYNTKLKANEIIEIVKTKFKESIKLQPSGYFETQKEINDNNQSYRQITEKAATISYALDNNELIDRTFDNIMTTFRDKFVEILKYMDNSVKEKFPLEQNVLGTTLFKTTYLNEIDDFFKVEKINILSFINNENDDYINSVNEHLKNFKNNDGKNLEQIMSKLLNQLTDIYLDNLNSVYRESIEIVFKSINEIIENNSNLGNQYLTKVKNSGSSHMTTGFLNKYNIYMNSIETIYNYVNINLKINLANKYKNVITQIRSLLQSIKSNGVLEKYYKQLPSSENYLNSIKDLFEIFNRHISDNVYNIKYLPIINKHIENTNKTLNQIKQNFKDIYDIMAKKGSNNILNDYDKGRVIGGSRYCCKKWGRHCKKHCNYPDITEYDGYNVENTNNHLNLKQINFGDYMKIFDNKYNELYPQFSNNIKSFNSLLSNLDNNIENVAKKNKFNQKKNYLENISQKIKSIINEKLGNNLLNSSYIYFKDKILNKLPKELEDIIEQWKSAYDQVYNDINSNKDDFKSSVYEFFYIGMFYTNIYSYNISYSYGKTVVEKLKNDFNYTNKYYYNIIISELNKTYAYILNNLPINEKPFDKILNKRIAEIKNSYNDILNELNSSKNSILDKTKQEAILQVNSNNFFYINDIIREHIKSFNASLTEKLTNIYQAASQVDEENPPEYIAAKFYLENSINGKQIKVNYDMIDKATFLDLQTYVYQQLIDNIWKVDRDELIKNILNTLKELNEINNIRFKYENEKYIEILKNKLYKEFETKENLIQKINSYFSNAINKCSEKSKIEVEKILDSVLNRFITHIKNESFTLADQLTSYSKDFTTINTRLNNYKTYIYEQFYSAITYIVKDFHEQIQEKYYKNFIETGINKYEENIKNSEFGTANFLNMSINLNLVIDKEFQLLITDYKNLTLNQIQFLYQKNIQTLDELFSFSNIKSKINNEIDTYYNTKLFPILKRDAINYMKDEIILDYDLSSLIIEDIDSFIKESIEKIKEIMIKMEGIKYEKNETEIKVDFNHEKMRIKNLFENFSLIEIEKEKEKFNKSLGNIISNNFEDIIIYFIPSFSFDFYDRILKFNEIQNINTLYNNLKYSLIQTLNYYINISKSNVNLKLPLNLKSEILSFNDIGTIVESKNEEIILNLKSKLNQYLEEEKNYLIQKYINDITLDSIFESHFNINLNQIIKNELNGSIKNNLEIKYLNQMEKNIINTFIEKYNNILNKSTQDMKYFIEISNKQLNKEMNNSFYFDSELFFKKIQIKLNNTNNSIEEYKSHFNKFKISDEVIKFFESELINEIIIPKYDDLNYLLISKSEKYLINNFDIYSKSFKDDYSIIKFKNKINKINSNITSSINECNNILNNYGLNKEIYETNLIKEKDLYQNKIANTKEKWYKINLDISFKDLKNNTFNLEKNIKNFNLFKIFEEMIDKNINEKNIEYEHLKNIWSLNKNNNNNYEFIIERLNELKNISLEYYIQSHSIFLKMKENIISDINKINDLIKLNENITYEIMNKYYKKIKNNFNSIKINTSETKDIITIPRYSYIDTNNIFKIETEIKNYIINNEFNFDLIYEENNNSPKLIGNIINNIKPKSFTIDFYFLNGPRRKIGRKIDIYFNNIKSYTNFEFDGKLNNFTVINNFNFDGCSVKTQYYEEKISAFIKTIFGITFTFPGVKTIMNVETPQNEKFYEIPSKNKTMIETYYF